jgi:DNA polymerase-1
MSLAAPGAILLLDTFSLFFRALHALPPMSTQSGLPTSALYGLSALLLKLFREARPAGGAFAIDPPAPTFRHAAYPAYKAGRGEAAEGAPEDALDQLLLLPALIEASGLPAFASLGYEADDVLATLAHELAGRGERPLVVSGDRDCLQLARGRAQVLYVARGVQAACYDEEAVRNRYGVPPELLPDATALVGDPSDNLPGVPGIGPRTAAQLLARFGGLPALLARLDEVDPPRVRERLREHAGQLPLWLDLARLRSDVPLPPGPRYKALDRVGLKVLFEELEFASLLPRLEVLAAGLTPVRPGCAS